MPHSSYESSDSYGSDSYESSEEWWEEWRERLGSGSGSGSGLGEFWRLMERRWDSGSYEDSEEDYYIEDLEGTVCFLVVLLFIVFAVFSVALAVTCYKWRQLKRLSATCSQIQPQAPVRQQSPLPEKKDSHFITVAPENPRDTLQPNSPPPAYN